ncbi:MAG: hypothetical protein RLZZ297_166 [Chloroflexota bacterium]|jgi:uncharacterized membrane protein YczE
MQFFTPSRTIPTTTWTATSRWDLEPKRLLILLGGLFLFGLGEAFFIQSNLGNSPWAVFASGVARKTGYSIEECTFAISCAVVLLWIPLREAYGIGPIGNTIVVAWAMGIWRSFIPVLDYSDGSLASYALGGLFLLLGLIAIGMGSALYITCGLGAGPRQGLMAALHRITHLPTARITTTIEVVVCIIGISLGGTFGIGTIVFALLVGHFVAISFGIVGRLGAVPDTRDHSDDEPEAAIDG